MALSGQVDKQVSHRLAHVLWQNRCPNADAHGQVVAMDRDLHQARGQKVLQGEGPPSPWRVDDMVAGQRR